MTWQARISHKKEACGPYKISYLTWEKKEGKTNSISFPKTKQIFLPSCDHPFPLPPPIFFKISVCYRTKLRLISSCSLFSLISITVCIRTNGGFPGGAIVLAHQWLLHVVNMMGFQGQFQIFFMSGVRFYQNRNQVR